MSLCFARRCEKKTRPGHLMCLRHWRMVPLAIQERVYQTWRVYRKGGAGLRAYNEAISAARDAATPAQERPQ